MYLCYGHDISLFITLLIAINISSYRIVRNINLPRYKVVSLMILNSERIYTGIRVCWKQISLSCVPDWIESVNLVQQRHSTGNPASNTREFAWLVRYYRFKVKRISRTWQSGLSRRVDFGARLCTVAFRFICADQAAVYPVQLTDSDILISPGYQRLTYFPDPIKTASSVEIKRLRHPSVHVSPNVTLGWKTFHALDVNPWADFNAS